VDVVVDDEKVESSVAFTSRAFYVTVTVDAYYAHGERLKERKRETKRGCSKRDTYAE